MNGHNISIVELERLLETIASLNEWASDCFDETPFQAAHMRFAAMILCKVRGQFEAGVAKPEAPAGVTAGKSKKPRTGAVWCANCQVVEVKVEGDKCPVCVARDADADKPAKVKHNYGPEGTCVLAHVAGGAICGEKRKRKPRSAMVMATPPGEGSAT